MDEGAMAKPHYIIMEELLELDCSIRGMQITQRKVIDSSFLSNPDDRAPGFVQEDDPVTPT